ncbi:MAG: polyribonucleotide nucleotidyltransferase [Candidatus Thermoplasmatota archaeon]|nr:polyribonucleotide nucleotidyltransferase [Euryarchaeota archaeon]MBU4071048.1 polyribonucleotide nucleotidyltransferase [Candidatus Thermoplasmatota archaeon]MBU4144115.1 polyribonucleotide nucleotidyltransferase [Candidatus Thermoplasmatota archaeon]MBU4591994.1 polyribonucleotide nucleotidyltransferase [Candidatus Thermoplasmatota archaeon]
MEKNVKRYETEIDGKKIIVETGKLAQQASAAVTVQMGETVVMVTAMISKEARDIDFFPLMVDYEERYAAAGRIKGPRFSKREGRPSTEAVLIGRMIDRGLRPLFLQNMRNEVQIICLPLSLDHENRPDMVAMLGACIAIHISEIPFDGPLACVRLGMSGGFPIINPTIEEMEHSELQLVVMGDGDRVTMVECDAQELSDDNVKKAFDTAMEHMGPLAKFVDDIRKDIGKPKLTEDQLTMRGGENPEFLEIIEKMKKAIIPHLDEFLFNNPKGSKGERKAILKGLEKKIIEQFKPEYVKEKGGEDEAEKYLKTILSKFFYEFIEEQVTIAILEKKKRVDGRKLDEIRPLFAEVGLLPRTHGSGLFERGETQILSMVTLGAPFDMQSVETMESDGTKKYFHHYNFLPYSVGEVKFLRGASRRDIGHGALAEKAMVPILPDDETFPYTIRVVSETMGSNGSSSMGSTCGSTLALLDAGVPIKKPVGGIAMGIASLGKKWAILTDIQDMEDGPGGMDFKFTGTKDGLTAIQMDTKTRGLSKEIIHAVFPQMRKALNEVIDCIIAVIPEPRAELSPYAPRIISFKIDPQKIGDVIGPGGKKIRAITEELDLKIDINDDGLVMITTNDVEKGKIAEKMVRDIVRVVEVDEIFEEAEVVKIMPFGAFLNLTPGQDGMLHVSEIEWGRVENVTDRVNMGDKIRVKVIKIENGKVDVSRKALLPKPEGYVEPERRPRTRDRDDRRGGDRRGGDRDRRSSSRDRDSAPRERRPRDDGPNRDGYAGERKDERLDDIEKRKSEKKPEAENTTETEE